MTLDLTIIRASIQALKICSITGIVTKAIPRYAGLGRITVGQFNKCCLWNANNGIGVERLKWHCLQLYILCGVHQ
ncbi:MAG: hypothetical protein KAI39_10010 [Desulfobulbaceae bacterium]|nr:hypothetical protein [Desulfobulbaceae bacterium]